MSNFMNRHTYAIVGIFQYKRWNIRIPFVLIKSVEGSINTSPFVSVKIVYAYGFPSFEKKSEVPIERSTFEELNAVFEQRIFVGVAFQFETAVNICDLIT